MVRSDGLGLFSSNMRQITERTPPYQEVSLSSFVCTVLQFSFQCFLPIRIRWRVDGLLSFIHSRLFPFFIIENGDSGAVSVLKASNLMEIRALRLRFMFIYATSVDLLPPAGWF